MSATGFCPVTNFRTTLSSSITSTQSNIPVSTITTTDGHVLTMADLGAEYYIVISPGASDMEIIKCNNIADGPPIMTASVRGLAFFGITETTATGNNVAHNAGAVVELTNTHYVYKRFVDKEADETVGGVKTFSSLPSIPTPPVADNDAASKKYVDDTVTAGAPPATTGTAGIVKIASDAQLQAGTATDGTYSYVPNGGSFEQTSTANKVPVSDSAGKLSAGWGGGASSLATLDSGSLVVQNPTNATATPTASKIPIADASGTLNAWVSGSTVPYTAGENIDTTSVALAVYIKNSDGKVYRLNTTSIGDAAFAGIGFAAKGQNIAANSSINIQLSGEVAGFSSLTAGAIYYGTDTPGAIATTHGTQIVPVGTADASGTKLTVQFGMRVASGTVSFSATGSHTLTTVPEVVTLGFRPRRLDIAFHLNAQRNTGISNATSVGQTVIQDGMLMNTNVVSTGSLDTSFSYTSSIGGTVLGDTNNDANTFTRIATPGSNTFTSTGFELDFIYQNNGSPISNEGDFGYIAIG